MKSTAYNDQQSHLQDKDSATLSMPLTSKQALIETKRNSRWNKLNLLILISHFF